MGEEILASRQSLLVSSGEAPKGLVRECEHGGDALSFRWDAPDYATHSAAQKGWGFELVDKLVFGGDETILDIGCGDGALSAALASRVPKGRVLGIDASIDMIRHARSTYPAHHYPNVSFEIMDAECIRLAREFDIAFSNACLHWVACQEAVLRGVHACLKPSGRILFQMGGKGNAHDVIAAVERVTRRQGWAEFFQGFTPPYHFHGPAQYAVWLEKCSFRPLRVELVDKDMVHPDERAFEGWLRTTWFPYTDRLPKSMRRAFLEEVVREYFDLCPPQATGAVHVAMVRLEVEAVAL